MKKLILILLASAAASASAVRVDVFANSFREGGWKLDVQFMDVMGSPYLLAHGLGSPVPDATATAVVPSVGTWRVRLVVGGRRNRAAGGGRDGNPPA